VSDLRPVFRKRGYTLPAKIRVSCGWPSKSIRKVIGQCFYTPASADETHEIFISPMLDDPMRVADVLVHELCHAAVGPGHGHGPVFKRCADSLDLGGKPTATEATPALVKWLAPLVKSRGKYPHAALQPVSGKKQSTRLLKAECPCCGYTVRVTRKWADVGSPLCPNGEEMEVQG
jgi:hypothetical protein